MNRQARTRDTVLGIRKRREMTAQSTYFTVRGQSYFSRLPNLLTPIPLSPRRVCPPPATKAGGTHTLAGRWGVNILEDVRHRIGLLQ